MAFTQNSYPSLVDWARRADPDGAIAVIAEMLSQCNDIMKDMIFQEANMPLAHKCTLRVALPQGVWRGANQGVAASKSMTAQYQFSIGELVDYSMVDKSIAELNGNVARFRYTEDMAHLEGLSQQVASGMFYLNEGTTPTAFTGFSPYYNSLSTTTAQSARNVIDGGGSGSSNLSMWLVGWGDNTTFAIFPKGSQAGLKYEDKGDTRPSYDSNGNQFEVYTSYFVQKIGLAVKDWRYNIRMANIDTTTAAGGLFSTTPPDLYVMMSEAAVLLPTSSRRTSGITESDAPGDPVPGITPVWYMNRTGRVSLDIQAIRDKNVLISSTDYAGAPVMMFRDIPIRVVDQLTNTETAIS